MKFPKISGVMVLALLMVSLAGCVGDKEEPPKPQISAGGEEIDEGIPPTKFGFEPTEMAITSDVQKESQYRRYPVVPGYETELDGERTYWRFAWNVTGLIPIQKTGDVSEAHYTAWVAKEDKSREEGVVWNRVAGSETTAPDGKMSGNTRWEVYHGQYLGVMISLETAADSTPEFQLLKWRPWATRAEAEDKGDKGEFESLRPFKDSFADAVVEVDKAGKVNLTVTAPALPETKASYDLFLKNGGGTHYLGTLKFDAGQAAHVFSTQPDPKLFTKYQFFISLEDNENKEVHGGFPLLTSKFSK